MGMLLMAAAAYLYILMVRKKMSTRAIKKSEAPMASDTREGSKAQLSVPNGDVTLSNGDVMLNMPDIPSPRREQSSGLDEGSPKEANPDAMNRAGKLKV